MTICKCYPPNSYAVSCDQNGNCPKCGNEVPHAKAELAEYDLLGKLPEQNQKE